MTCIRRYKQKKLIPKISVDSKFTFTKKLVPSLRLQKSWFPKFQLISNLCLQVMHDYIVFHCSTDYCVKLNLVDENLCENCSHFILNWFQLKAEFILERKRFFIVLSHAHFRFFEVKSVLPIDQYQNATSNAISLHELKKVHLQERYTPVLTQDSIGHLKTLCMSVLSLTVAFESEWKCYSSSQSDKKKKASIWVWIQLYSFWEMWILEENYI